MIKNVKSIKKNNIHTLFLGSKILFIFTQKKVKRLFFILSIIFLNFVCIAQKIEGVVTYYFNDNIGIKPDVGAEVHIIRSNNDSNLYEQYTKIEDFAILSTIWTGYNLELEIYNLKIKI